MGDVWRDSMGVEPTWDAERPTTALKAGSRTGDYATPRFDDNYSSGS